MKFKIKTQNINKKLQMISKRLPEIVDVAFAKFVAETPKDTGNAKSSTKKQGNEIIANYAYANRLNKGYSKQSPDGMTEPTIKTVRQFVRRILRT